MGPPFDETPLHQTTPIEPEDPACWRLTDVESAVDDLVLDRLVKYHPFTIEFIAARPDLHSLCERLKEAKEETKEDILGRIEVKKFIEDGDAELRRLLLDVPFRDWTQEALGLSPKSLTGLKSSLFSLRNRLRRSVGKKEIQKIAKKVCNRLRYHNNANTVRCRRSRTRSHLQ